MDEMDVDQPEASSSGDAAPKIEARRNPKRTASALSQPQQNQHSPADIPSEIIDESLKPLTEQELKDWGGWIEVESEPAFFNIILRDLGVKHIKVQEILSVDPDGDGMLVDDAPNEIYGLIFLHQYNDDEEEPEAQEDARDVWFANQTVDNACATVAMLNIIMNANGMLDLGPDLSHFKEVTRNMPAPLKGHALSENSFVRSIHNGFTRRIDILNADLVLEQNAQLENRQAKRRTKKTPVRKMPRKSRKRVSEAAYHYVAYVPVQGHVWELDGLRSRPAKLCEIGDQPWTTALAPIIRDRMEQLGGHEFNLLALCQSRAGQVAAEIAGLLSVLRFIHRRLNDMRGPCRVELDDEADRNLNLSPGRFKADDDLGKYLYGFTRPGVPATGIPRHMEEPLSAAQDSFEELTTIYGNTTKDVDAKLAEYRQIKVVEEAHDEDKSAGRKMDYTPAIHAWVRILAEKQMLEGLAG